MLFRKKNFVSTLKMPENELMDMSWYLLKLLIHFQSLIFILWNFFSLVCFKILEHNTKFYKRPIAIQSTDKVTLGTKTQITCI